MIPFFNTKTHPHQKNSPQVKKILQIKLVPTFPNRGGSVKRQGLFTMVFPQVTSRELGLFGQAKG